MTYLFSKSYHFFKIQSFVFLLTTCLSATPVISQELSSTNKKALDAYAKGVNANQERNLEKAFSEFEEAIERDRIFAEAYFQLGKLYEQTRQFSQSIQNYEKAYNSKEQSSVKIPAAQQVGQLLFKKGDYSKALFYLEQAFPTLAPNIQKRYKLLIENCKFSVEGIKNPLIIKPLELPKSVNTFYSQYFPVLTADRETLVFTGLDNDSKDENIFISRLKENTWTTPETISDKINSPQNEGTASISADGRMLVFTSCNNRKGIGSCDLFISYKNGDIWTAPVNLGPNINSGEWESQPSLSADGRALYFVSDRRGGFGKRDIYVSKIDSTGKWAKSQNLGNVINTYEDDLSPFIHANGKTLFFSSEGHVGFGGADLYFSENQKDSWTKPENLGYPINTHESQVALFITSDGKKGYYSLENDVAEKYRRSKLVEIDLPESLQAKFKRTSYLKGIVFDAKTKQKLQADIELIALKNNELQGKLTSDIQTGEFASVLTSGGEYAVFVSKAGYFFKSFNFDFSQKDGNDKTLEIALEPIQKNTKEVLNNIFFETAKWDLKPESKTELDKLVTLLKTNPNLPIEISGHTDDVGKDADNLILSQKRAKSVVEYLAKNGVNTLKISTEGYGKSKPISPNNSEENRKLNRRIEVKFN